jgi:uncharacterized protein YndB with AHSA1/START domain
MIKVDESIIIQRPVEEVFAFVADQRNAPEWQSGLLEVRRTDEGPLGVGATHAVVRKFMGRRMEVNNEYVAYELNAQVTFKSTAGPMPFEFSYLTESTPTGTRLTGNMQVKAAGFMGLAEPLIGASMKREMRAAFGELKDLLENQAGPATA